MSNWVADRLPTDKIHLDVAACGRISQGVLDAITAHLRLEAEIGGYVAELKATPEIDLGRAALASTVGLAATDVVLSESGGQSFASLLDAWPLPRGSRIGTVPSEYGGNARVLQDRASARGWQLVLPETDELGRIGQWPVGLDLITYPHIASQRGIVQPVPTTDTPWILDVAQALGQTDLPEGAAAYVGTSRKWLCGPRGVGFAIVDPAWHSRLADPPTLGPTQSEDLRRLDSQESFVAGRVGLAQAARTWSPAVLPVLLAAAQAARVLLAGAGGWTVIEPVEEASGITTLRHPTADAFATRAALLESGFVISVVPVSRAADLTAPVLRVSTAAWTTPGDLEALATALDTSTQ